jgi:drug/metabolite transporter (DMT)-like permease
MNYYMNRRQELRGTLLVGMSGMLYGLMGFFGNKLFHLDLSVSNMLFWRFLIASLSIAGSMLISTKQEMQRTGSYVSLFKIFVFSAISYSGGSMFYFLASQQIGTGIAMVIFFSFPVFVTFFAWWSGTWRVNRLAVAALLAVILGLVLLRGHDENTSALSGVMLAILGAVFFAAYVFGSKQIIREVDSKWLALGVCIGNTMIFLILSMWGGTLKMTSSITVWFYVCAIGIIATALPIQLLLDGLKYISPVKASILSVLEPVVTLIVGIIMLNEAMSMMQVFGVMIVLFGAILIQFEKSFG